MDAFAALLNVGAVSSGGQTPRPAQGGRSVPSREAGGTQPSAGSDAPADDVSPSGFSDMLREIRESLVADGPGNSARPPVQLLGQIADCENLSPRDALLLATALGGMRLGFWKAENGASGEDILMLRDAKGKDLQSGEEDAASCAGAWMGLSALLRHPELADQIGSSSRAAHLEELVQQIQALLERLNASGGNAAASEGTLLAGIAEAEKLRAGNAESQVLPDLVYFSEASRRNGVSDRKVFLVAAPGNQEDGSIQALQDLLNRPKECDAGAAARTGSADAPAGPGFFTASQLKPGDSSASGLSSAALSDSRASELADAVRQTQAVIANMLERMEGAVRFDQGGLRAVIHLEPPALGRVHVQLAVDDARGVQAQVGADNESTRDFLRQNQSDLREELVRQGFHPEKVEICFEGEERSFFPHGMTAYDAV